MQSATLKKEAKKAIDKLSEENALALAALPGRIQTAFGVRHSAASGDLSKRRTTRCHRYQVALC